MILKLILDLSIGVRNIFLDISKAFDKVWHKELVCKLKSYRISGNLLKLIENYLTDRKQRVVLNGQTSSWQRVLSGVPQRSVLGPLHFSLYKRFTGWYSIYLHNICG